LKRWKRNFWKTAYRCDDASFVVKYRYNYGEIVYTDETGRYSVPIERAVGPGLNFCASAAIDIETGRWIVGEPVRPIMDRINEGFMECDGLRLSIACALFESFRSPKSKFAIGDREVTFDEWAAHVKAGMPQDGDQSPYYGWSGKSPST
jgi:hypothetical protein